MIIERLQQWTSGCWNEKHNTTYIITKKIFEYKSAKYVQDLFKEN